MLRFLLDLNKCVGCEACVVACFNENKLVLRNVNVYNEFHHPLLSTFRLSLSCNHCLESPCLKNCPANAYSRSETGAVLHSAEKCIGCKFCTWQCPYDAPKYQENMGTVAKCTFCNEKLLQNEKPACVLGCPTGALSVEEKKTNISPQKINGFTEKNTVPLIRIIPLREENSTPILQNTFLEDEKTLFNETFESPKSKISLKKEFPLTIFTFLATILVSTFLASAISGFEVNIFAFAGAGILATILSTLHLGKPLRAFRAIFNLKNSWLSREIFFFGGFLFGAILYFLFFKFQFLAWLTGLSGLIAMFSIDMVYQVARPKKPTDMHSADTLLTSLCLTSLFIEKYYIFLGFVLVKSFLYLYRKFYFHQHKFSINYIFSILRILFLLFIPAILFLSKTSILFWGITFCILISEFIDRCEFYSDLDVITPKKQIFHDIFFELKEN